MRKNMMILASLLFLLAACLPVQNQQELDSRVNTAVAQTMEANNQIANAVAGTIAAQSALFTLTAEVEPSLTPTETPSITFTPITPTSTPLPINPTATYKPAQPLYACNVVTQKPANYTEIKSGSKFDIRWTIVNVGLRPWVAGVDVKFASGTDMANPKRVEIPKEILPGYKYVIDLDATAPNKKGTYSMTWVVAGPMCYPSIIIVVK